MSCARMPRLAFAIAITIVLGAGIPALAADEIRIGGTGTALGTMRLLADAFAKQAPDVKVTVMPGLGSGGGIRAVVKGAIDLGVSSRTLTEDERNLGATQIEYGRTPFVFAVASKSKVTAVTLDQLAAIYAGKMLNWPDGSLIRIVLRPVSDFDTSLIKSMSPDIARALSEAEKRPGVTFAITDQDAADRIGSVPGLIGATTLALIASEKRDLRALTLNGVEPTIKNAVAGAYPYFKLMFFVTGAKPSAAAQRFIAFVQSPAGREILARTGHWVL